MRNFFTALSVLACSTSIAAAQQPHVIDSVIIEGPELEAPPVTPLEVAQSLDAVRKEIAAAKETYGEESAQVRLLTEILHNLEGTFRQQLTDRGMIRTAGHQESADEEDEEAEEDEGEEEECDDDDEDEDEGDDEAEDEEDEHEAEEHGGHHHGHNNEAIARLTQQVRELRSEVEKLKQQVRYAPIPQFAPPMPGPPIGTWQASPVPVPAMPPHPPQAWPPAPQPSMPAYSRPFPVPNVIQPSEPRTQLNTAPAAPSNQQTEPWWQDSQWNNNSHNAPNPLPAEPLVQQNQEQGQAIQKLTQRIVQLERENAALRQQRGGAPAGPRAERVLNALRDQTMQHQAEATKHIEQSFEQMQRRLQELEQRGANERPREQGRPGERRIEERRIEEYRRDARPPRTSSAQPL